MDEVNIRLQISPSLHRKIKVAAAEMGKAVSLVTIEWLTMGAEKYEAGKKKKYAKQNNN
ncbi:MAG: hypothetical protein AAB456_00310 [Patescibacteria group bacterium]